MIHVTRCGNRHSPAIYQIRVQGELDQDWADWFDDGRRISSIAIAVDHGVTTVTGTVVDQSALYGLLGKMRDLSLTLLSVSRIECQGRPA